MSKKAIQYMVIATQEVVTTLKEVSAILDKKVTKAMIANGEVPEVEIVENTELVLDENEESLALSKLADILEDEDDDYEYDTDTEEDIEEDEYVEEEVEEDMIEEPIKEDIVEEVGEEDLVEEVKEVEPIKEDIVEVEPIKEDIVEIEPIKEEVPTNKETPTMEDLMAKMKSMYASKEAKGETKKATGKSTKIEFTGEYPEKGTFDTPEDLKKFYKQLSDDNLDEWISLEDLEYKESDNEPINRMRKCMAIRNLHFPKKAATKKKSKYAAYSTEDLLQMAIDNDVEVSDAKGDVRILRMYTVVALKKAGLLE